MSRYIDADVVMEVLERSAKDPRNEIAMTSWANAFQELIDLLDDTLMPMATADVVEVVRCKDCTWWKSIFSWNGKEHKVCVRESTEPPRGSDDYCSFGERKEDESIH